MKRRSRAIAVAVVVPLALLAAVVASWSGSGSTRTPRKLPLSAGANGTSGAAADEGALPAIARMPVRYVAGPNLPALDGKAKAYKVTATVDEATAARLAAVFGVTGTPQESALSPGTWTVGEGEHATLMVLPGGTFSYTGFDRIRAVATKTACAVATPSDGTAPPPEATVCSAEPDGTTPTTHPAGFPGEEAAKATALDRLRAAGVLLDGARVTARDDGWAWSIGVRPVVDGVELADDLATAQVDETGLVSAWGSFARPEPFDEYPLIGTAKAIQQLNDGTSPVFGIQPMVATGVPTGAAAGGSAGTATATATGGTAGGSTGSAGAATCGPDGTCTATASTAVAPAGSTAPGQPACSPDADCIATASSGVVTSVPETTGPSCTIDPNGGGSCPGAAPTCPPPGGPAGDIATSAGSTGVACGVAPCESLTSSLGADPAGCVPPAPCSGAGTGSPGGASATGATPLVPCPPVDCGVTVPGSEAPTPASDATETTGPTATCPPVEPEVITLTGARQVLLLAPSGANDAYLVPAYRFTVTEGDDGPQAVAIDASFIEPFTPPVNSCGASSDGSGGSGAPCPEPLPAPEPLPVPEATSVPGTEATSCGPPVQRGTDATPGDQQQPPTPCPIN